MRSGAASHPQAEAHLVCFPILPLGSCDCRTRLLVPVLGLGLLRGQLCLQLADVPAGQKRAVRAMPNCAQGLEDTTLQR